MKIADRHLTMPTVAVYCDPERRADAVLMALARTTRPIRARTWDGVAGTAARAACSVLCIDSLDDDGALHGLAAFKARFPAHPVVLVTRRDADNMRAARGIVLEEVVWLDEARTLLAHAVQRACVHNFFYTLGDILENAPGLSGLLRQSLSHACTSDPPIHTVRRLAAAFGCDRRTLWRHWRRAFDGDPPLRLEDFVHWLILIRAAARKVPRKSWREVAFEVGVHEHTLARLSTRLAHHPLPELTPARATDRFTKEVLAPFLPTLMP